MRQRIFILKNENEAKDIVQALFLDIWQKKLFLAFHEDVKGYLFVAVKNRSLNCLKSQRTNEARKEIYSKLVDEEEAPEPHKDEAETPQWEAIMGSLKGQKKAALEMVYLYDKKYKDAASEMKISVNSFKTHLKGAIKVLRESVNTRKINPF